MAKKSIKNDFPRVMIEKVSPEIDGGNFPVKRTMGEKVTVRTNVFGDGHDEVRAFLLYRACDEKDWQKAPMAALGNDLWEASFIVSKFKDHFYSVSGYICEFSTWGHDLQKRVDAGRDVAVDLKIGAKLISETAARCAGEDSKKLVRWAVELETLKDGKAALAIALNEDLRAIMEAHVCSSRVASYGKELRVSVERDRAAFSSWYEFFPRSWGSVPGVHGTFKECQRILPEIARMGFDIIYFPPIHPVGKAFRKGKNNAVTCTPDDPGSPWAIGSADGGHKAVNPQLGTLEDFKGLVKKAGELKLEVALDIAFQCSPDHPYLKEHPQWFKWRPDGTVQYAENPPKKYEDIVPFNFETEDRAGLWEELKSVFLFWAGQGVKVFRVDNPHTKAFLFWDWVIAEVRREYPEVIFLSEAFTRPNIMYRLAKGGFTQSYTYFTWRNSKREFQEYLTELTQSEAAEFFRPNFWPNTPDILPEHLQTGGRAMFMARAVLASTLSSNFGIYGPAFELCVSDVLAPGKEEYIDSEKYEVKRWDWDRPGNIKDLLASLNKIRRENPALQVTRNIRFCQIDNEQLLAYTKVSADRANIILVVVNLDSKHTQAGWLKVPLEELGIEKSQRYQVQDLLTGNKYTWQGESNYIELDPRKSVAHIFRLTR